MPKLLHGLSSFEHSEKNWYCTTAGDQPIMDFFSSMKVDSSKISAQPVESLLFNILKITAFGFSSRPLSICHDPIQSFIAVGFEDGTISVLGNAFQFVLSAVEHKAIKNLGIRERYLYGVSGTSIIVWDISKIERHSYEVYSKISHTCLIPSSTWLMIAADGFVKLFDVSSCEGSEYSIHPVSENENGNNIVYLKNCPVDNNTLLIVYSSGIAITWNIDQRKVDIKFEYDVSSECCGAAWDPDGGHFVLAYKSGTLIFWSNKKKGLFGGKKAQTTKISSKLRLEDLHVENINQLKSIDWEMVNGQPTIIISCETRLVFLNLKNGKYQVMFKIESPGISDFCLSEIDENQIIFYVDSQERRIFCKKLKDMSNLCIPSVVSFSIKQSKASLFCSSKETMENLEKSFTEPICELDGGNISSLNAKRINDILVLYSDRLIEIYNFPLTVPDLICRFEIPDLITERITHVTFNELENSLMIICGRHIINFALEQVI